MPSGFKGVTKTQISLRVPSETLEAARAEAAARGVTMSEVLRSVWELRIKIATLPPHLKAAIVDTSRHNRIVEFIGIKGNGEHSEKKSENTAA